MPIQLTESEAFFVYLGGLLKRERCTLAPEVVYERWRDSGGFNATLNEAQLIVADLQATRGMVADEAFALYREKNRLPPA
jgi:hypothetical protein